MNGFANGSPAIQLSQVRPNKTTIMEINETRDDMETELSSPKLIRRPNPTTMTDQVNHMMLQTLVDIKQEMMKEVDTLNHRMSKLDSQIDVLVRSLHHETEMPPTLHTRMTDDSNLGSSTTKSPETVSTGSESNSSLKAVRNRLTKSSKVSPAQLPVLKAGSSSPTKASMVKNKTTTPTTVGNDSVASGLTAITTVDASHTISENSQRKDKMSNLDML